MAKWRNWEKMFEGISLAGSGKEFVINDEKREEKCTTLFILCEFNKANLIIYSVIITDIKCMRGLPGYESAVDRATARVARTLVSRGDRTGRPCIFGRW
jgi:hypothetical protein